MSENFSDANNLQMAKATEKQETYLGSHIIQDSKTVHRFCASFCDAPKMNPIRVPKTQVYLGVAK